MAFDDVTKERLAYVSGNILICGLLSFQIWPVVSRYQTGMHINFWTDSDPGGAVVGNEYFIFMTLTSFLTVLVSAGVLAVFYLFLQGIRLGVAGKGTEETKVEAFLHNVSENIYGAIFLLGLYLSFVFFSTPIILLVVYLERVLALHTPLSATLIGWILRLGLLLLGIVLVARIVERIDKASKSNRLMESFKPFGKATVIIALVMGLLMSPIVQQLCYTADIEIEHTVIDRSQCKVIPIYVSLGGATSDVSAANLELLSPTGINQQDTITTITNLGAGRYIAFIPCSKISDGPYKVSLKYQHLSLASGPPFIVSTIYISKGFYVVS